MENLYEVLLGTLEDPETIKWIAGQYLTPEKNPLTADKMSGADHGDLEKASAGAFGDVYGDPEEEVWCKEEKV